MNLTMKVVLRPEEIITVNIYYNPIRKGRTSCDVKLSIEENPYEYYTVSTTSKGCMIQGDRIMRDECNIQMCCIIKQ